MKNLKDRVIDYVTRIAVHLQAKYLAFQVRGEYDYYVLHGSTSRKREALARELSQLLHGIVYTETQFPNSRRKKDIFLP